MGIRKKVTLGFICLGLLLIGSSAVSFFELGRIGKRIRGVLEESYLNMSISRELLDGAEMQHLSLLHNHSLGVATPGYDSLYAAGRRMFAGALEKGHAAGHAAMDGIDSAYADYERVTRRYFFDSVYAGDDWLETSYWKAYTGMTSAIKEYMTGAEYNLGDKASVIESNAYRAITPGLVTIAVLLLLLFIMLYFIDFYYMKPVSRISSGIAAWLKFRTPLGVSTVGRDEAAELKENVQKLIDLAKKSEQKK